LVTSTVAVERLAVAGRFLVSEIYVMNRDGSGQRAVTQTRIPTSRTKRSSRDERDRIASSYPTRPIDELMAEVRDFLAKRDSGGHSA
jgi:hypothetical protein